MLRHVPDAKARPAVLIAAMILDAVVLAAFCLMKGRSDPAILGWAAGLAAFAILAERVFLRERRPAA